MPPESYIKLKSLILEEYGGSYNQFDSTLFFIVYQFVYRAPKIIIIQPEEYCTDTHNFEANVTGADISTDFFLFYSIGLIII